MAVFKCKMCGGTLEINNETVAVCQYCGTKQTLPKLADERKANLYDRANHFRRNNEFDKAMGIYDQILNEDSTDAESYWSLVLCRYGIEYVEDPSSRKRIPTINRSQFTSVYDDEDYKSAIKYADEYQKELYESEANTINEIHKRILAISSQEEPFDVFICYKESDNDGRRTPDSVLATELYHELTREGYKVFFSRITLEDKLGTAYEPYIFAALNSAKVMVVLGTKPEYFNAVWVKNEWSRYLALIKNGARKMLIPAYKDMDPYDLPEEFSHLQAQDMSKLGFMQDLVRGIQKIVKPYSNNKSKDEIASAPDNNFGNVTALLKRGFMALEDNEWIKADDFFEQCLNQNAELAEAYLGKLMAELQIKSQDCLKECTNSFFDKNNYQKAIRFANTKLKSFLIETVDFINNRNEKMRVEEIYQRATEIMNTAELEESYKGAATLFESIEEYNDAKFLAIECREKAESARKEIIYLRASDVLNDTHQWIGKKTDINAYEESIKDFQSIGNYKDSQAKISLCYAKIDEIKRMDEQRKAEEAAQAEKLRLEKERQDEINRIKKEKRKKAIKTASLIGSVATIFAVVFVVVLNYVIVPHSKYQKAIEYVSLGKYNEAYDIFVKLEDYKESSAQAQKLLKFVVKKGDIITFGTYEQDNNKTNGNESIDWIVLERKGNKVLLISKYTLDCQMFNDDNNTAWENSHIRAWLNNDFYKSAFDDIEQKQILTTSIDVSDTTNIYGKDAPIGKNTQDNIFLLSKAEADEYFTGNEDRKAQATEYSKSLGAYTSDGYSWWWLRTINIDKADGWYNTTDQYTTKAVGIFPVGNICDDGYDVTKKAYCSVRPAMWIDMENID